MRVHIPRRDLTFPYLLLGTSALTAINPSVQAHIRRRVFFVNLISLFIQAPFSVYLVSFSPYLIWFWSDDIA